MAVRIYILSILSITYSCYAWGNVTLIPYLSQQLELMRQSINVSNSTLREIKSLQRGINDPIGELDYALRNESDGYREISNVYRQGKHLYEDSKNSVEDWNKYFEIDSKDQNYLNAKEKNNKKDTEKELIYLTEQIKHRQKIKRKTYEKLSKNINKSSSKAKSGAQAEKINAKAQAYLLEQGNDSLELQEYQMALLQNLLANQKAKDEKKAIAKNVEYQKLIESFEDIEPVE